MNKKMTLGLTALALVIAIFAVTAKLDSRSPAEHRTRFFPHVEERSITALVITEGETSVKLHKEEGAWMVSRVNAAQNEEDQFALSPYTHEEAYADSASVQIAIEKIISMRKRDLVSDNPANQSTFGVDSANAISVTIFTSGGSAAAGTLRIGRSGPDWNSSYVHLAGTNSVYTVPGGLRHSIFSDFERWRKVVVEEPEEQDVSESYSIGN